MARAAVLRIHLVASLAALLIIASFLASTATVEAFGDNADVHSLKRWILRALLVLVPAIAIAGVSGRKLAGRSRAAIAQRKLRRLRVIAATGITLLIPCAITLERLAAQGNFGLAFRLVQTVEFVAGAFNLTLLTLNFRDGMRLRTRRTRTRAPSEPATVAPTK